VATSSASGRPRSCARSASGAVTSNAPGLVGGLGCGPCPPSGGHGAARGSSPPGRRRPWGSRGHAGLHRSGGRVGVQGVGLTLAASSRPGRAGRPRRRPGLGAQPAREPGAVAAGAFHADSVHAPQRARPGKQRSVAGRGGGTVRVPSSRPAWSSAAATCVSAWVSTPRVTSAAGPGRVAGPPSSSLLAESVARTSQTTDGQHCDEACGPGSYQVTSSDRWCQGAHPARPTDPMQGTRPVDSRVRPAEWAPRPSSSQWIQAQTGNRESS